MQSNPIVFRAGFGYQYRMNTQNGLESPERGKRKINSLRQFIVELKTDQGSPNIMTGIPTQTRRKK
jgi:hypothetical protein